MSDNFRTVTCPYCQEHFTTAGETPLLIGTRCTACGQRLMVGRRKLSGKTVLYKPVNFWIRFVLAMVTVALITFYFDPGWLGMDAGQGKAIPLLIQLGLFVGLVYVTSQIFMETGGSCDGE